MEVGQPTSANTAPYLIALSMDFSIDPLINGVYSFSNSSSSWSDERRASVYADLLDEWDGQLREKERTVSFAENRTSREPLCFPIITSSVLLNQIVAEWFVVMTDSVW